MTEFIVAAYRLVSTSMEPWKLTYGTASKHMLPTVVYKCRSEYLGSHGERSRTMHLNFAGGKLHCDTKKRKFL